MIPLAEPERKRGNKRRRFEARLRGAFREVRFRDATVQTPPKEIAEIGRRAANLDREGRREEEQPQP